MSESESTAIFGLLIGGIATVVLLCAIIMWISPDGYTLPGLSTEVEEKEVTQLTVLCKNILPNSMGTPTHSIIFRSSNNEVFIYTQSAPFVRKNILQVYYNVTEGQTYNCSIERHDDYSSSYIDILEIDGVSIKN
jgi:hypothetical protein